MQAVYVVVSLVVYFVFVWAVCKALDTSEKASTVPTMLAEENQADRYQIQKDILLKELNWNKQVLKSQRKVLLKLQENERYIQQKICKLQCEDI